MVSIGGENMRGDDLLTKWKKSIMQEDVMVLTDMLHRVLFPVDALCDFELTGLFIAILENKNESATLLIEHGADIQFQNHRGLTPLMLCVLRRNVTMCKTILSHGVNIDMVDENGQHALYYAIQNNHEEITTFLLDKGCYSIHERYFACRDLLSRIHLSMFRLLYSYHDQFNEVSQKAIKAERLKRMFV